MKKINYPIYKYTILRDLIAEKGKKQGRIIRKDIAQLLGVHINTIQIWLNIKCIDDAIIKDSDLEKIAEYFKVDKDFLKSKPKPVSR